MLELFLLGERTEQTFQGQGREGRVFHYPSPAYGSTNSHLLSTTSFNDHTYRKHRSRDRRANSRVPERLCSPTVLCRLPQHLVRFVSQYFTRDFWPTQLEHHHHLYLHTSSCSWRHRRILVILSIICFSGTAVGFRSILFGLERDTYFFYTEHKIKYVRSKLLFVLICLHIYFLLRFTTWTRTEVSTFLTKILDLPIAPCYLLPVSPHVWA